MTKHMLLS
jgi:hypothetical protein